jgi:hypothetical protein
MGIGGLRTHIRTVPSIALAGTTPQRPQLSPRRWGRFLLAPIRLGLSRQRRGNGKRSVIKTLDAYRPRFHDQLELPFEYRPEEDDGKGL